MIGNLFKKNIGKSS